MTLADMLNDPEFNPELLLPGEVKPIPVKERIKKESEELDIKLEKSHEQTTKFFEGVKEMTNKVQLNLNIGKYTNVFIDIDDTSAPALNEALNKLNVAIDVAKKYAYILDAQGTISNHSAPGEIENTVLQEPLVPTAPKNRYPDRMKFEPNIPQIFTVKEYKGSYVNSFGNKSDSFSVVKNGVEMALSTSGKLAGVLKENLGFAVEVVQSKNGQKTSYSCKINGVEQIN